MARVIPILDIPAAFLTLAIIADTALVAIAADQTTTNLITVLTLSIVIRPRPIEEVGLGWVRHCNAAIRIITVLEVKIAESVTVILAALIIAELAIEIAVLTRVYHIVLFPVIIIFIQMGVNSL